MDGQTSLEIFFLNRCWDKFDINNEEQENQEQS